MEMMTIMIVGILSSLAARTKALASRKQARANTAGDVIGNSKVE